MNCGGFFFFLVIKIFNDYYKNKCLDFYLLVSVNFNILIDWGEGKNLSCIDCKILSWGRKLS